MSGSWKQNVWMLWFSQLLVMAGYDAMNPFVPLLLKESMRLTEPTTLAFFISLYNVCSLIGYAVGCPLWGYLGDRHGMKIMLLRGTFLTSLFWPIMGYVGSPWLFVGLRLLTAFLAGTTAASQMMIARTAPVEHQGFAQGVLTTAIWGGSMLGNMLGGIIISKYSYSYAFWICGIMYFVAGFSILFTNDEGSRRPLAISPAASSPTSPIRMLADSCRLNSSIWILLGLFMLCLGVRRMELPFVALRIADIVPAGQAARSTGFVSAVTGIGAILSGIVFGYIIDRVPARRLLLPICLVSACLMYLQSTGISLLLFTTVRTLYFFIIGALHPLLQKLLTEITPHEKRGLAFGMASTAGALGGIATSVLGGLIFGHFGVSAVFFCTAIAMFIAYPILDYGVKRSRSMK